VYLSKKEILQKNRLEPAVNLRVYSSFVVLKIRLSQNKVNFH
jgi:hypothetical protein